MPNVERSLGLASGDFKLARNFAAEDTSAEFSAQTSFAARVNSNFSGPFNFMLAASWFTFEGETDYFARVAGLDYFSLASAGPTATPAATFNQLSPGFYNNETPLFELDSRSVFGEAMQAGAALGLYDADPNNPGNQVFREADVTFKKWTGRIVLDWAPSVSFSDETLLYASYSRGYKGGGINPPIDTTLFPNTPVNFQPEEIDAFEIGAKNRLWGNRLQANMSLFAYDYTGLQALAPALGYAYRDRIEVNLKGNSLPNSPQFTVSLGGQYTHTFAGGASLAAGLDYYWQDEYTARIFNRRLDRVAAWGVWNAQLTYTSARQNWFVRLFAQNLGDKNNITGIYSADQSSGNFTNAFFIEPRLFGLTAGVRFN